MLCKRRSVTRMARKKPEIIQIWSPLIRFARFCGIIPLKKLDELEPYFERCPVTTCWSLMVAVTYLFIVIVSILDFKDTFNSPSKVIVQASIYVIYYSHCEATVLFFIFRSQDIVHLLQQWIETERFFARIQIRLGRVTILQIWFLYGVTLVMSFADYSTYIVSYVLRENNSDSGDLLTNLLDPYFGEYKYVYFHFLLVIEPLSESIWITGDLIIAIISILLRRYCECLHQKLLRPHDDSQKQLEELRRSQLAVSALARKVDRVFSPLVLITVGFNVMYILAALYAGLEEELSSPSILVRFSFLLSFVHLILRMAFSVYLATRLTDMFSKTVDFLYSRPSFLIGYDIHQQRSRLIKMDLMIQQTQMEPIALSGGGFFVLSKTSAAKLFSLIVTYEVVMLQLPR